jgi:hypothetical protein
VHSSIDVLSARVNVKPARDGDDDADDIDEDIERAIDEELADHTETVLLVVAARTIVLVRVMGSSIEP